jgi:hypothetical protein
MSDSTGFESKPHDGYHGSPTPWGHDKKDWRGWLDGMVSYGNYAGPGNRYNHMSPEEQAKTDPASIQPIDGIDALAQQHDQGYGDAGIGKGPGKHSMWSWDGIRATHDAESAERYSRAMRGLFGGRYKTVEAADWLGKKGGEAKDGLSSAWNGAKDFVGDKAAEAKNGIGGFINEAKGWDSVGDAWSGAKKGLGGAAKWVGGTAAEAASGIGNGIKNGAGWLKDTGKEAWQGAKSTFDSLKKLGPTGALGAVIGSGEAVGTGIAHLGGKAASGAKNLWHKLTPWSD